MSTTTTGSPTGFDTVLVANRGEIALRVLRAARAAGHRTVAVYSDADADAPHVDFADQAVRLGPAPSRESYLDIDKVVEAARSTGAGAIHPGYGFLAENADFAEACAKAGIVFVGPGPEAIRLMGDKAAAKHLMQDAGVPLLPGYQGVDQSDERLLAEAEQIGLPLMVKAAAGGGGKGMRLVTDAADLPDAIAAARREASSAFGSDVLILERALLRPRHVEVQVLADAHGNTIALGERDCSVQRRHQKVVEEAPCPVLDADTRVAMQEAAVAAARSVEYVGAGTVEFLLEVDDLGNAGFFFLEMNTRLQVEHPVTELVTGVDLVDWQLRIAAGDRLDLAQQDVTLSGHAIEVRLYAEDADQGFLPQTGTVRAFHVPAMPGLRVDAGIASGSEVTAHYDPMLAKVIAHGRDRDEARRRLADTLDRLTCLGVTTNRTFLARVLREPTFAAGEATTALLAEADVTAPEPSPRDLVAIAGWWHLTRQGRAAERSPGLAGWTNAAWLTSPLRLEVGGAEHDLRCRSRGDAAVVRLGEVEAEVRLAPDGVVVDGERLHVAVVAVDDARLLVRLPHLDLDVTDLLHREAEGEGAAGAGVLQAPMHGVVTAVHVAAGDEVASGDPLVVMEAMKMEHVIRADVDGTVEQVAEVGAQVADGDVVCRVSQES